MAEQTNEERASERIAFLKKNCGFCKARSRLRSTEGEKKKVMEGLENLVNFYQDQFIDLRRKDAPTENINAAIENKRLCMGLLEECDFCDNEVDIVNRGLNKIAK